jgi:lysozyme
MTVSTTKKVVLGASGLAVIAYCVAFTPTWEGMDPVAKRDAIGTGHPITYCYGQTDEFGRVKAGTRFTKAECDQKLAESLPHYLALIEPCITVPLPTKTTAALLDAAYNAGPGAVCNSSMLRKMNAGDLRGGCDAFKGWYVRSDGVERNGLIARRSGVLDKRGKRIDSRKSERDLCLEGVKEGLPVKPIVNPTAAPKKHIWQY